MDYKDIKCLVCGVTIKKTGSRQKYCSSCYVKRRGKRKLETLRRFRRKHPNYYRINKWFYPDYTDYPLGKYGYCLSCGDNDLLVLNNHHIFGRNNSDITITICANCHEYIRKGFSSIIYQGIEGRC